MPRKPENGWRLKRLESIDFRLFWRGRSICSDIMEQSGMLSVPQASKTTSVQISESGTKNLKLATTGRRNISPAIPFRNPGFITLRCGIAICRQLARWHAGAGKSNPGSLAVGPETRSATLCRCPSKTGLWPSRVRCKSDSIKEQTTPEIFYQPWWAVKNPLGAQSPHASALMACVLARAAFATRHIYKDFLLSRISRNRKKL